MLRLPISLLTILLTLALFAVALPAPPQNEGPSVISHPFFLVLTSCLHLGPLLPNSPTQMVLPVNLMDQLGKDRHRCEWLQNFGEPERDSDRSPRGRPCLGGKGHSLCWIGTFLNVQQGRT